jgi:histone acetyltransferase (RNA polymerase elongator complex component)
MLPVKRLKFLRQIKIKPMDNDLKDFIIPVFIPHAGCPNQCVFCNQNTVTGKKETTPSEEKVGQTITEFLKYKGVNRGRAQIAFYGGNFLGLGLDKIERLLSIATEYVKNGFADSIRFSTRPDTIDDYKLVFIKNFPVSTIELGVQSMDDAVLALSKRGHTSSDTKNAVDLLKEKKFNVGLQMMIGLPGDDESRSVFTARRICELYPDFVRIYPTVVLAGSRLAAMYKKGEYVPLSLQHAVSIAKKCYLIFWENNIRVIRMGLQATEDLDDGASILAGPYHPAFGHLVYSEVFLDNIIGVLKAESTLPEEITIRVNPKSVSKLRGLKNGNIGKIKSMFGIKSVHIIQDADLSLDAAATQLAHDA